MPYEHKGHHRRLNSHELADAKRIIEAVSPGRYRVRDLYGEEWDDVSRPRSHGRSFSESVRAGALRGGRWVRKRSDKAHEYEVLPRGIR